MTVDESDGTIRRNARFPLAALLNPGRIQGQTRLQKYMFVLQERTGVDRYEFEAHDYGPFSRKLYADVDEWAATGFIEREEELDSDGITMHYFYSGTEDSRALVDRAESDRAQEILEEVAEIRSLYDEMTLIEVINRVFTKYPRMARNAVI